MMEVPVSSRLEETEVGINPCYQTKGVLRLTWDLLVMFCRVPKVSLYTCPAYLAVINGYRLQTESIISSVRSSSKACIQQFVSFRLTRAQD